MAGVRARSNGALEALVMRALWQADEALGARAILGTFADPVPAYTTVLTVLTRLEEKGMVEREAISPRKVRFRPRVSSAEAHARDMVETLDEADDRRGALLAFADTLSSEDIELMRSAIDARRPRGAAS
ncbi:BlaI/MecI/CopY family transcriptional regulator [Brachybacterium sp. MASK1Z-5]|uniref:BlaI/MecI/CopY family transcriptional regulator n=1 Tax=Brachybacterium halotolerans TaxID=2795215 RepID=A0ABS1BAL5_9MICO|nr:BlaI/MecI/CopY family transcriptional regulator [Brachybacterium halotolerans]MBK0331664.1 BlaI/MecI/CopY family transcriptional regulator [Brachybacterium halotolerans]